MRNSIFVLCIVFAQYLHAQNSRFQELMNLKPEGILKIKIDSNTAIYLRMPFSNAFFSDISQLRFLPNIDAIYGIDLVYTRYKDVDTFNQPKLNFRRYQELFKKIPNAFSKTEIRWRVIEQNESRTKEAAEKCFHGFVIYLKNDVPDTMAKKEILTITKILESYKDTMVFIPVKIDWKIKKTKIATGKYLPNNKNKRKQGITYNSRGLGFRDPQYKIHRDSTVRKKTGGVYKKVFFFDTTLFKNTNEFKLLTKRKWSTQMAVVADVTGSMTPFSTQVLLWIKYNPEALQFGKFAFFNDGNNTPDAFKKIGNTGGIYFADSKNFDSVFNVMTRTMSLGLGGDLPENNLEAVKAALKRWPDTDTVLMIADNNAPVKDMLLLSGIGKPVSVLACGVTNRIHPDYIKIVTTTGGKLFVLDKEIQNLKGLKNGNRINIGSSVFECQKGALFKVK